MALYAFDGTWNDAKDAGTYGAHTNVVEFHKHYPESKRIFSGVGTRYSWLGKSLGGAFGVGGKARIQEATAYLAERFRAGDRVIDIVGFSRGSALAIHFANVIAARGVRDPASGDVIEAAPRIRFLGLWDLVASFGIPINIGIPFQRINLGYRLSLPDNVDHCFHALSLDELRQTFRPTRVEGAYEVWFRGAHSDVGGGSNNPGLSNIAFAWMARKAALAGVSYPPDQAGAAAIDPSAEVKHAAMDKIKNRPREVRPDDRVHHTVTQRAGAVNPPASCPRETAADEAGRLRPLDGP